jgi:hypothetical protein
MLHDLLLLLCFNFIAAGTISSPLAAPSPASLMGPPISFQALMWRICCCCCCCCVDISILQAQFHLRWLRLAEPA